MIVGTPWRMMVLVTGCTRICAESGTCLMQTTMCMPLLRACLSARARDSKCRTNRGGDEKPVQRQRLESEGQPGCVDIGQSTEQFRRVANATARSDRAVGMSEIRATADVIDRPLSEAGDQSRLLL